MSWDPRRLSLSHLSLQDHTPPEQAVAAAAAGFGKIGIRVWSGPGVPVAPMLGDTPLLRETLHVLAETGLGVLDVEFVSLRPDSTIDEALPVLDAAHRLGARFVLALIDDPDTERAITNFVRLCQEAAVRGLTISLEFMVYSQLPTLARAVQLLQRADQPNAVLVIDPLHLRRSGGSPADLAAVPTALMPCVQLCDAPAQPVWPEPATARAEARSGRLLPGDGELPLLDLLDAVPASAALSVETPVAALTGRSPLDRATAAFAAAARVLAAHADRTPAPTS